VAGRVDGADGTAALRQSSQRELLAVFAALVVLEKDD